MFKELIYIKKNSLTPKFCKDVINKFEVEPQRKAGMVGGNAPRIDKSVKDTIDKKDGGYTEFFDGTRLQPECGSVVFFPATWTFVHRGYKTKVNKYLCNGWIYAKP